MGMGYLIKHSDLWLILGNGQRSSQLWEASVLPEGAGMEILAMRQRCEVFDYLGKEESGKT